jgi:hypothetical protein
MSDPDRNTVPLIAWVLLLELIVILFLVTGSWMHGVAQTENESLKSLMGEKQTQWIKDKAAVWYQESIISPGVIDSTYNMFVPTSTKKTETSGVEKITEVWSGIVQARLDGFFTMVYQVLVRLALMLSWSPFMAIVCIPALLDGAMTWRIRQHSFANTSVMVHRLAMRVTGWSMTIMVAALFLPFPVSPLLFPVTGIVIIISAVQMTINTQKRV